MNCKRDRFSFTLLAEALGRECKLPSLDDFNSIGIEELIVGKTYIHELLVTARLLYEEEWQQCYRRSKVLLNITWEHLNTGHWKDVHISWRRAYSCISILKSLAEYVIHRTEGSHAISGVLRSCDLGLLMGAPILNNILCKLAAAFQNCHCLNERREMLLQEVSNVPVGKSDDDHINSADSIGSHLTSKRARIDGESDRSVPVLRCPSLEYFQKHYMNPARPVIIEGAVNHWPALSTNSWSVNYMRRVAGLRTVPVEIGSKYTEDAWSQSLMTVDQFIDRFMINATPGGPVGYLAQHNLFDQIPELLDDICVPEYCALSENETDDDNVDINAWFGPGGTVSPLHQDPKHNLLTQVFGEKYIKLIDPGYTAAVYPHGDHILFNTSQVDVMNPDLERFPLFADVQYTECILKRGQMLYIPPKYWHYVTSLSPSFSVSFWWT